MKLKKPKFWDLKNPNILAFLLWPLSIFFKAITKLKKRKKLNLKKLKLFVWETFILVELVKLH